MRSILSTSRKHRLRGVTVIEVLTSILVALIGVFGVLILIPFATRQAERGLDRDVSTTVGRNAIQQLQIQGFYRIEGQATPVTRWLTGPGATVDPTTPAIFSIDPLLISENGFGSGFLSLPDPNNAALPAIPNVSLANPAGGLFTIAESRQLCRSTDDLVFGEALDDLGPPQQVFDVSTTGPIRRQSRGEFSWSAVAVPVKDRLNNADVAWKYRMSILVYKDRSLASDLTYPAAAVDFSALGTPTNPVIGFSGGVVALQAPLDLNKDDWVMMTNVPGGEAGFDRQVGFYRVIGVDPGAITLDGPDFVFSVPDGSGGQTLLPTQVISLNGIDPLTEQVSRVVNVYERTFRWEQTSFWNQ